MLWLLYHLANNPKVQQRVYEEVLSLIGPHGDFNSESFAKLQYIKACERIHEVIWSDNCNILLHIVQCFIYRAHPHRYNKSVPFPSVGNDRWKILPHKTAVTL